MNSKEIIDAGAATPANNTDDYASNQIHSNTSSDTSFKEADAFLKLLDSEAKEFTFQTFDDNADVKNPSLVRILHGSLQDNWEELISLNKKGAGVFVTVNETDGKGRKKENIIGIRAIWIEADHGIAPDLPITPHIKVETSPGNFHLYFLTPGPSSEDLDKVSEVQNVMVEKYGSDPNAKDISRVLRLPGFQHMKVSSKKGLSGKPYFVRVVKKIGDPPYSWGIIKKMFPPINQSSIIRKCNLITNTDRASSFRLKDKILGALQFLDPDCGYSEWLKVGMALRHSLLTREGLKIWDEWSEKGGKYLLGECETKWPTFKVSKDGAIMNSIVTVGTIYYMAKENGWNESFFLYSSVEIVKQIESLYKGDTNEADEIYCRIDEALIEKAEKSKLQMLLSLKTTEETMSFKKRVEKKMSFKMSQGQICTAFLDTIGPTNLVCANDAYYRYDNGMWRLQEDRAVKNELQEMCEYLHPSFSNTLINGVIDVLKTRSFINKEIFHTTQDTINCLNGEIMLDIKSDKPILNSHVREHYHLSQIPVEYNPQAVAPRFERFLNEVFEGSDDAESRKQLILEFMGYSLLTTCELESFIFLVGGGANGKSVLLQVLEQLLGPRNVCSIPPSKLEHRFMSAQLHGKLANIVTEVAANEKIDDAKIKSLASGEQQTAERKGRDHFEFHPFATMWFATNYLPRTNDPSKAMLRRTNIVQFPNAFNGSNRDTRLKEHLVTELPGILAMSIDAIFNALKRGGFIDCPSSDLAKATWVIEADPIPSFISGCCDVDPQSRVLSRALYEAYTGWVSSNGVKYLLGHKEFSSRLKRAGYHPCKSDGARYISGLSLRK